MPLVRRHSHQLRELQKIDNLPTMKERTHAQYRKKRRADAGVARCSSQIYNVCLSVPTYVHAARCLMRARGPKAASRSVDVHARSVTHLDSQELATHSVDPRRMRHGSLSSVERFLISGSAKRTFGASFGSDRLRPRPSIKYWTATSLSESRPRARYVRENN